MIEDGKDIINNIWERYEKYIHLIVFIAPLIIVIGYSFVQYARNPLTPGFGLYPTLNETEKTKVVIINMALERALVEGEIIDVGYPDPTQPVVLSTRNIDPYWVQPIDGWDIQVLTLDEIKNDYKGVTIHGKQRKRWVQFNKIKFKTGGFVKVEMGLMRDEFSVVKWGVAYWGLEIWFEYTREEGWIIQRSRVMVI